MFERRHGHEIERAENIAAGLPPEGAPADASLPGGDKKQFREPNLQTPAHVEEEKRYEPVTVKEQPKGIVETIRVAAATLVKRVQRTHPPLADRIRRLRALGATGNGRPGTASLEKLTG